MYRQGIETGNYKVQGDFLKIFVIRSANRTALIRQKLIESE